MAQPNTCKYIMMMSSEGRDHFSDCAPIVPVKVKYFQTFPNETKNADRITHRFNILAIAEANTQLIIFSLSPLKKQFFNFFG
jgi:hypothetical protein